MYLRPCVNWRTLKTFENISIFDRETVTQEKKDFEEESLKLENLGTYLEVEGEAVAPAEGWAV